MWELIRYTLGYINKRSTSFAFSLGSIAYGFYHFSIQTFFHIQTLMRLSIISSDLLVVVILV